MTNTIIEAQNDEDDCQYLQWKQKRFVDTLLLGFQTVVAMAALSLPAAFWLYAQHARAVLGHYPIPTFDDGKRQFFNPFYKNLVDFAFVLIEKSLQLGIFA